MVQKTIKVNTGQSKASAGANTWAASLLGDKKATAAVNRSLWGTSNRKYTRTKQVWECAGRCGSKQAASEPAQRAPVQRAPRLTAEEKKLQAIENQISAQDRIINANARIAAANAKKAELDAAIAELDANRLADMSPGERVINSILDTLKLMLKLALWGLAGFFVLFLLFLFGIVGP
ncbi:hypothetical protein OAD61_00605 [bacterium]|nr:hypothetical protein [bacterium]